MQVRLVGLSSCGVALRELLITYVLSQVSSGLQVHVWSLPVGAYLLSGSFIWVSVSTAILAAAVRVIAWRSCPQACTSFWNSIVADGVTPRLIPTPDGHFVCMGEVLSWGRAGAFRIRTWQVLSYPQFLEDQDVLEVYVRSAGFSYLPALAVGEGLTLEYPTEKMLDRQKLQRCYRKMRWDYPQRRISDGSRVEPRLK